jgi:hypothetical protein
MARESGQFVEPSLRHKACVHPYSYGAVCSIPFGITYRDDLGPERSDHGLWDDGHDDDRKHNVCNGLGESVLVLLTPVMDEVHVCHIYASW